MYHLNDFRMNTKTKTLIIRGYSQGESLIQAIAYEVAKDKIRLKYPQYDLDFDSKGIREITISGVTAEEHADWLTDGDACMLTCHPFEGDFPPDWNYIDFLRTLNALIGLFSYLWVKSPHLSGRV